VMIKAGCLARNAKLLTKLVGSGNADSGHHADATGTTLSGVATEGTGSRHATHLCGRKGRWANYGGFKKKDMAERTSGDGGTGWRARPTLSRPDYWPEPVALPASSWRSTYCRMPPCL
jgi:hypothetical protein